MRIWKRGEKKENLEMELKKFGESLKKYSLKKEKESPFPDQKAEYELEKPSIAL